MKSYQKIILIVSMALLFTAVYFYLQRREDYTQRVHTVLINILKKQIDNEKAYAFNFAFALSQNDTLQKAIIKNEAHKGYKILREHMRALEVFSKSHMHAQILTTDMTIFARSWDNTDAGLNVKKYRPDLDEILKEKKPHLAYEAARKLVLIASIPIVKEGKVIGIIEVIRRFSTLQKKLAKYDIDFIALLDDKFKANAVLLHNNPTIKHMIVANDDANVEHIRSLRQLDMEKLFTTGILEGKSHYFFSKSILNHENEKIGYFVLIVSKKKLALFNEFEAQMDSFFTYARKDLYYSLITHKQSDSPFSCLQEKKAQKDDIIVRGRIE